MHQYRCDNKCHSFEDKPGQLQPPKEQVGDWIGWCHLRSGNLLVLRSTYDLICYFGCASHSDFQSEWDTVLDGLDIELDEIKSRIESSAMGWPLSERSRGEIIGLLHVREKIKYLRQAGSP